MKKHLQESWRGIVLIFATYFYFLIFAQFAFLELLASSGDAELKPTMAIMALMGITGSLATPKLIATLGTRMSLSIALLVCSLSAVGAIAAKHPWIFLALSGAIGAGLGVLTVTVTASLRSFLSPSRWGLAIGLGTGLAYALANFPPIFTASPSTQAWLAGGLVLTGWPQTMSTKGPGGPRPSLYRGDRPLGSLIYLILVFLALVWLDSAAFFIIQHTPEMKASSWGDALLWRNAGIHFLFALLAGWLLEKHRLPVVTSGAFVILALASLCLNQRSSAVFGGWLYPAGVSLYSTALVAAPAFLMSSRHPAWVAAILYSIAGWFGSANGIGMAETLNHIPLPFLLIAGLVFLAPRLLPVFRQLQWSAVVFLGVIATGLYGLIPGKVAGTRSRSAIDRGRAVYLSEGCIHCHSRYVRPNTRDEILWGPVISIDEIRDEAPVLIGNRRTGPDLLNVGNRRSRAWLKQHFINPQSLSPGSAMPSYAHLFIGEETRGEDLIDFLMAPGMGNVSERYQQIQEWQPRETVLTDSGASLFAQSCRSCHGTEGRGDGSLAGLWTRPPANLVNGPFFYSDGSGRREKLARIIKFGLPGTDMPGHETLSDEELTALTNFVLSLRQDFQN